MIKIEKMKKLFGSEEDDEILKIRWRFDENLNKYVRVA